MRKILMGLFVYSSEKNRLFKLSVTKLLLKIRHVIRQESKETKEMLNIYMDYSLGKATKEDMEKANKQFKDLLRTAGIGVILVLPLAPITLPFFLKLGEKLGIEMLPSAMKEEVVYEDAKEKSK